MMERDEAGTHASLKAIFRDIVSPLIKAHSGRIVRLIGDGALVEFPSAVEAVSCAFELQRDMQERNAPCPEDKQVVFRIGINLGDLIIETDGDIYGDGVNIAARLEGIAPPGGIAISRAVRDQVQGKLPFTFTDRGEQHVKNIARPVNVYAVTAGQIAEVDMPDRLRHEPIPRKRNMTTASIFGALVAVVLGVGGMGAWWLFRGDRDVRATSATHQATLSEPTVTSTPKQVPPRQSLVVLPFDNLSGNPEHDYFADGVTEDLTTDLSQIPGSFVIARNTAFTYKERKVDVRQVGRELGVRYALEGSVRRIDDKARVNVQLIDTETGGHLWAERFETNLSKLSELQNDVTGRLTRSLDIELSYIESRRSQRERPDNPDAVDLTMRGVAVSNGPRTRENIETAIRLFEQALKIDPNYPSALVGLGRSLAYSVTARYNTASIPEVLNRAEAAIAQALTLAPNDANAHFAKGELMRGRKRFYEAIASFEAAIALNQNLAPAYAQLSATMILAGRAADAFTYIDKAIRLSPRDPQLHVFYHYKCHAYTHLARDDDTIEWCRKAVAIVPFWASFIDLISAYGWKGMMDEAHTAIAELKKLMPNYTVSTHASADYSDNPTFRAEYARITEGLRKAGLPES
jgi:TolB-like protein/Tfp pilus assembly protein PilF